jgi:UDP-N-acetylmuramate--alanine ligase
MTRGSPASRPFAGHRYHFSGVGGSGMAPLAALAVSLGAEVTGSDRNHDRSLSLHVFDDLRRAGVRLVPQDGSGVDEGLSAVIHSTAVEAANPDLQAAAALGLLRVRRGSFLANIAATRRTVAIAGTSGKSSVAAMTAHILVAAGLEPSYLGGGAAVRLDGAVPPGSLRIGGSDWFVVETDESDGSVAEIAPAISVLTNLSRDHKEIAETARYFETMLDHTWECAVVNVGDPYLRRVRLPEALRVHAVATEGRETWAAPELCAQGIHLGADDVAFTVGGVPVRVPFPGALTVENAILAIGAASAAGVSIETAARALATFAGVRRRLERIGASGGVDVFDDFAHNPIKIAAALQALRPRGSLWVYYQPHGYGPTRFFASDLIETFRAGLQAGDRLLLAPIYDAGGTADRSIRSEDLVASLHGAGVAAELAATREDAARIVTKGARDGDRIVVMGARDDTLSTFARALYAELPARTGAASPERQAR